MAKTEIKVTINPQQVMEIKQFVRQQILDRAGEPGPGVEAYTAKVAELETLKRQIRALVDQAIIDPAGKSWHDCLMEIGELAK
jgi:hypothetical protein